MLTLLRALYGRLSPRPIDPRIEQLTARAVEQIDPRLKSFSNYPRAYFSAIEAAQHYVIEMAKVFAAPLELSPHQFAEQPLLHALFNNVEAIYATVRESRDIKHYCEKHGRPPSGELYALMGMRRKEKTVFGQEVEGDAVLQDVQQTLVSFSDHTLMSPAEDEETLREKVELQLFDSLIKTLAGEITVGVAKREELEIERDILSSRLRLHPEPGMEESLAEIRKKLETLTQRFSLPNYPKLITEFMSEPQQHLYLDKCDMPIDMRGIKRESSNRLAGTFSFCDLVGRDRRRWTLLPVRLPVEELQEVIHCASEKERWIEV